MDWIISHYEHNRTVEIMQDLFELMELIDLVLHFEDIRQNTLSFFLSNNIKDYLFHHKIYFWQMDYTIY